MEPEVQSRNYKGSAIIPESLKRINLIPRIDIYSFKIHSSIVLSCGYYLS